MNVIIQIATTKKTDVCPADIAETADCAGKAVQGMQFQESKKMRANLNMYPIPINV